MFKTILVFTIICSNLFSNNNPKLYSSLGDELFDAIPIFVKLKSITPLTQKIKIYEIESKLVLNKGKELELQKNIPSVQRKEYLNSLRKLEKKYKKIIIFLEQELLKSIEKNNYNNFILISNCGIKSIFNKEIIKRKAIKYYEENKHNGIIHSLEKLKQKQILIKQYHNTLVDDDSLPKKSGLNNYSNLYQVEIEDINNVLSKNEIKLLSAIIDKEVRFHKNHLSFSNILKIPVRVFVSEDEYITYQHKTTKITQPTNGYFSYKNNEIVIKKNAYYLNTIVHEAQHFIFGTQFIRPPLWINEGLSEFYETAYFNNEQIYVRKHYNKTKKLKEWLEKDELPSIKKFLSISNKDWRKEDKQPLYKTRTISWGLVYFLMSSKKGRQYLSNVIKSLHQNPKNSSYVLDYVYEGGINALEKDFFEFIHTMPEKQILWYRI